MMKNRRLAGYVFVALSTMAGVCESAEREKQLRSLRVELPNPECRQDVVAGDRVLVLS